PPLREARQDTDSRDSRRAGLPRAGHAGAAVLRHVEGEGGAGAPRLFPRRESLDPEAAELAALVPRILQLGGALCPRRPQALGVSTLDGGQRRAADFLLVPLLAGETARCRRVGQQTCQRDRLAAVA